MTEPCEEKVLKIRKKLERMVNGEKSQDGALNLMTTLGELPISLEILQSTRIGMTVNDLRKKATDSEVTNTAKVLIKRWKRLLTPAAASNAANGDTNTTGSTFPRTDSIASNLSNEADEGVSKPKRARIDDDEDESATSKASPLPPPKIHEFPQTRSDKDEIRDKCTSMVLGALKVAELPLGTLDVDDLANRVEVKLFEVHKSTNDKYKAGVRSRVFNLRKNQALRENVLTGVVLPEKLAVMTTEEMASEDVKKERDEFTKQAINDAQLAQESGNPTDMFKCGKCQGKSCTYTQMQTRSADEPMTTFVRCRDCGNRWKF